MKFQHAFDFDPPTREKIWSKLIHTIENYITNIDKSRVSPELHPDVIRSLLAGLDLKKGSSPLDIFNFTVDSLWDHQLHTTHPQYYGLFNPASTVMSIVADALVAAFNPQLAAWSHSPFANEVERFLISEIGQKFGYSTSEVDGTFTTGGTEANFTAVLTSLTAKFPNYLSKGAQGLGSQSVLYSSSESHHSVLRAARISGLGSDTVRLVPVDDELRMDIEKLQDLIESDLASGLTPFLIVATAGTTNAGIVDPITSIAELASSNDLWLHVDAAWGGAAVFSEELRESLAGIDKADSITFDAHKWFSVPMGAGMFLTRHNDILNRTFAINTDYMPREARGLNIIDPYTHSVQWSRRFIGLKVFLSLAVAGWDGYSQIINHQNRMGEFLRAELKGSGWKIMNKTALPVVCFIPEEYEDNDNLSHVLDVIVTQILDKGKAWISTTVLDEQYPVIRACITNYRTDKDDVRSLVKLLNETRSEVSIE